MGTLSERVLGALFDLDLNEDVSPEMYLPQFSKFRIYQEDERVQQHVRNILSWAVEVLKKNNSIQWFLRWWKLAFLQNRDPDLFDRELAKAAKALRREPEEVAGAVPDNENRFRVEFEHFYNENILRNVPAIARYTFQNQTPAEVLAFFEEEEQKWHDKALPTRQLIADDDLYDEEVLIEYPNGTVWSQLDRNQCFQYGNAMGHCGTPSRPQSGTTMLALRRPVRLGGEPGTDDGDLYWYPMLFFELDPRGYLRQTKGRKNAKPAEKYYPYIVDLLKLPLIKGIQGGGYKPENNFHWDDLDSDQQDEVMEANPEFSPHGIDMEALFRKEGMSDRFVSDLYEMVGGDWRVFDDRSLVMYPFKTTLRSFIGDYIGGDAETTIRELDELVGDAFASDDLMDDEYDIRRGLPDETLNLFGDGEGYASTEDMVRVFLDACRDYPEVLSTLIDHLQRKFGETVPDARNPEAAVRFALTRSRGRGVYHDILTDAVRYGWVSGSVDAVVVPEDFWKLYAFVMSGHCRKRLGSLYVDAEEEAKATTVEEFIRLDCRYLVDVEELFYEAGSLGDVYGDGRSGYDVIGEDGLDTYALNEYDDPWREFEYEYNHHEFDELIENARQRYTRLRVAGQFPNPSLDQQLTFDGNGGNNTAWFNQRAAVEYLRRRMARIWESKKKPTLARHALALVEALR